MTKKYLVKQINKNENTTNKKLPWAEYNLVSGTLVVEGNIVQNLMYTQDFYGDLSVLKWTFYWPVSD